MKTHFQVTLNQSLEPLETIRLKETQTMYGVKHTEYGACTIQLEVDEVANAFSTIASWLDNIGAAEDIFSIQKVETHYTGYVLPEVKELTRT